MDNTSNNTISSVSNAISSNVLVKSTSTKSWHKSPQICRDYLNNACTRSKCRFRHEIPIQNNITHGASSHIAARQQKILVAMKVPKCGHTFIEYGNILAQQNYDGLVIVNANDFIDMSIIDNIVSSQSQRNISYIITLADRITNILNWFNTWKPYPNLSLIFHLNIAQQFSSYIIKTKIKSNYNIACETYRLACQFLIDTLYEYIPIQYNTSLNFMVAYLMDGFQLVNTGVISFTNSFIMGQPGKYLSNGFNDNIYLAGTMHYCDTTNIGSPTNINFLANIINSAQFVSLNTILGNPDISAEYHGNGQIYKSLCIQHRNTIISAIKNNQTKCHTNLQNAVTLKTLRDSKTTPIIFGCNLDILFDKQIITGLKSVIQSYNYNNHNSGIMGSNPSKSSSRSAKGVSGVPSQPASILNECCVGGDGGDTVGIISVNVSGGGGQPDIPDIMKSLFGGMLSSGSIMTGKSNVTNKIHVINIGLTIHGQEIDLNRRITEIKSLDKLKTPGVEDIFILMSAQMTHTIFSDIIAKITKEPEYPNKIHSKFIDFDINPALRSCLGYYNYQDAITNSITISDDTPINNNCHIWARFIYTFVPTIRKHNTTHAPIIIDKESADCCNCCKCLSRNGVEYVKYGKIPYIESELLANIEKLDTNIWLPRY